MVRADAAAVKASFARHDPGTWVAAGRESRQPVPVWEQNPAPVRAQNPMPVWAQKPVPVWAQNKEQPRGR